MFRNIDYPIVLLVLVVLATAAWPAAALPAGPAPNSPDSPNISHHPQAAFVVDDSSDDSNARDKNPHEDAGPKRKSMAKRAHHRLVDPEDVLKNAIADRGFADDG